MEPNLNPAWFVHAVSPGCRIHRVGLLKLPFILSTNDQLRISLDDFCRAVFGIIPEYRLWQAYVCIDIGRIQNFGTMSYDQVESVQNEFGRFFPGFKLEEELRTLDYLRSIGLELARSDLMP